MYTATVEVTWDGIDYMVDGCFFFQAEDGIRDATVTGVQTCALPISSRGLYRTGGRGLQRAAQPQPAVLSPRHHSLLARAVAGAGMTDVVLRLDRVFKK